jgi:hypothetical protein
VYIVIPNGELWWIFSMRAPLDKNKINLEVLKKLLMYEKNACMVNKKETVL